VKRRSCAPFYSSDAAYGKIRALFHQRRRLPVQRLKSVTTTRKKKPQKRASARATRPWSSLKRNGSNLNVEDFLTFKLTRLSNALRNNLTKPYLEEFGLSLPEWRLLALIARFAPMRFSEVTTRSGMDKGQVSRTLRVMEKRGLTKLTTIRTRGRSAEALAAPVMVSITAKGKSLYKSVLPVARARQAEMLLTLNQSERLALYDTLDKLSAAIGATAAMDYAAE
jgi:DNA-binding MarR family transcriptional regulator